MRVWTEFSWLHTKAIGRLLRILELHEIQEAYAVAQLVEALCYKSEGRGFDSE